MGGSVWQDRLDEQQVDNLPLVGVCAIVVQIMALGRDAILGDFGWFEPVTLGTFASLAICTVLTALARSGRVSRQYAQASGMLIIVALALRPYATMPFRETVFPMVDALVVFAIGVCLLSIRYFYVSLVSVLIPWATIAFLSCPPAQAAGMLALVLVAAVIGYLVLQARIRGHERVFSLRQRVSDLESLLPLCANCKDARMENGTWVGIEQYLLERSLKVVTHSICPECFDTLYPEFKDEPDRPHKAVS